jgi:hypothetical protein
MGKYQRLPYYGIPKETEREEDLTIDGEDRLSNKRAGAEINQGFWKLTDRSGTNS